MKKVNKILMIVTSILLSLVLISTCIVSGTLAKFAITKDATTVVSLKQFGVRIKVTGGTVIDGPDANSVTVTCDPVELYPGISKPNAVLFAFEGKLNVPATLTVRVKVDLDDAFYITDTDIPLLSADNADMVHVPIKFGYGTVTSLESTTIAGNGNWMSYNNESKNKNVGTTEATIASYLCSNFRWIVEDMTYDDNQEDNHGNMTDWYATKEFPKDYEFKTPDSSDTSYVHAFGRGTAQSPYGCGFGFGFKWDTLNSTDFDTNLIDTYLAEKFKNSSTAPIKVTFTVSLEQKLNTTT